MGLVRGVQHFYLPSIPYPFPHLEHTLRGLFRNRLHVKQTGIGQIAIRNEGICHFDRIQISLVAIIDYSNFLNVQYSDLLRMEGVKSAFKTFLFYALRVG